MLKSIMQATQLVPHHQYQVAVNLPGFYYIFCESFAAFDEFLCELYELEPNLHYDSAKNLSKRHYAILIVKE